MSNKKSVRNKVVGYVNRDDGQLHLMFVQHTEEVVAEVDANPAEAERSIRSQLAQARGARDKAASTFSLTVNNRVVALPIDDAIETMEQMLIALHHDRAA